MNITEQIPGDSVSSARARGFGRGIRLGGIGATILALLSCSRDDGSSEEMQARTASIAPGSFKKDATSAERFRGEPSGMGAHGGQNPHGGGASGGDGGGGEPTFTIPPGWKELPPTDMRRINLQPAASPELSCYVSITTGAALENVNRWRKQFALDGIDATTLERLPRARLFDFDAYVVDCEGTFSGAGGAAPKPGFKLIGVIASFREQILSVKMTGPAAAVDQERKNFESFVNSLRMEASPFTRPSESPHGANPATNPSGIQAADSSSLKFTVPNGWTRDSDHTNRVVTLLPNGSKETECAVSAWPGPMGGVLQNINRWRIDQFSLTPITSADLEKLPRVQILGRECVLVEITGSFRDNMNHRSIDKARLVAAICERPDSTLFFKMSGPDAEVMAAKDAFVEFCKSFKE